MIQKNKNITGSNSFYSFNNCNYNFYKLQAAVQKKFYGEYLSWFLEEFPQLRQ